MTDTVHIDNIQDVDITVSDIVSWADWLNNLECIEGNIYIATFSLPDLCQIENMLKKRPYNIYIVAHSKFLEKAECINSSFPDIPIALREDIHAKFALSEPDYVCLSSANFGRSGWFETAITMRSRNAFNACKKSFRYLFNTAATIVQSNRPNIDTKPTMLKPCPFCGEDKKLKVGVLETYAGVNLFCVECGSCEARGGSEWSAINAVNNWNKRNNH